MSEYRATVDDPVDVGCHDVAVNRDGAYGEFRVVEYPDGSRADVVATDVDGDGVRETVTCDGGVNPHTLG